MLTLNILLHELSIRKLIILHHGVLWSPNQYVPMPIRRAIKQHRRELCELIAQADIRLCPDCDLHRQYFHYANGEFYCEACRRLQAAIPA